MAHPRFTPLPAEPGLWPLDPAVAQPDRPFVLPADLGRTVAAVDVGASSAHLLVCHVALAVARAGGLWRAALPTLSIGWQR